MCSQDGNKVLKTAIQTQLSVYSTRPADYSSRPQTFIASLASASARRVSLVPRPMGLGTRLAPVPGATVLGLGGLCWHNFENNRYQKALSIMRE